MKDNGVLTDGRRLALSIDEMAAALGISRPVAYELARRDGFPAVRVGERRLIVPVDALRRWLDAQAGVEG